MRKLNYLMACMAMLAFGQGFAQTALVQFIHNSGDAQLQSIDIYADETLIVSSLNYHFATEYVEVPADMVVNWAIAPAGSGSATDAVASINWNFDSNQSAVAVINGLAALSGYIPIVPLNMHVYQNPTTQATELDQVDMLFVHGSTDLPMVSLRLEDQTTEWVSDLFFGQFTAGYNSLSEANWMIDMLDVSNNVIDQFELPLQNYGLAGSAVTAVIGGFNNPESNFMGEPLAIWLALPEGGLMLECPLYVPPQYTQAQIIHASADPAMQSVDIYVDGNLFLDDFNFLTATPFIDIEAMTFLEMLIAPDTSTSDAEAFAALPIYLNAESDYIITIQGNLDNVGFYPYESLQLQVFEGAMTAGLAGPSTNILFINAATDMPAANIHESELLQLDFAQNWAFGSTEGYFEILTADYVFDLQDPTDNQSWASYVLPLTSYSLGSDAMNVVAIGYTNPAANMNGQPFGLYAALYAGGPMIPLNANLDLPMAQVQFIHNAGDPQLEMVDVYINNAKWIDDLAYLHASPFVDLPVIQDAIITVTPHDAIDSEFGNSWNMDWQTNERYILTLNGFLDGQMFNPNMPLSLHVQNNIAANAAEGFTAFTIVNGSTDAPSFYTLNANDGEELIGTLSYNTASPAAQEVPTLDFALDLMVDGTEELYKSFGFPANTWLLDGQVVTLVAAGYNNPADNNNGLPFGLWMASAAGGALLELPEEIIPTFNARAQLIHGSADALLSVIDVYMNGNLIADDWSFREATPFMDVPAEVPVVFSFAPATSNGPIDAWVHLTKVFAADETYYGIANGLINEGDYNPFQPFDLSIFTGAAEQAADNTQTDIVFYHSATDTPGIDASEITLPMPGLLDNLMFDGFGGYLSLPATNDYAFEFSVLTGNSLGQFGLPVNAMNLQGQALLVFASGFLNPGNNNDGAPLGFYAALADGTTFPLTAYVDVEESDWMKAVEVYPNPTADWLILNMSLYQAENLDLELIDINGKVINLERNLQTGKTFTHTVDVRELPEGFYFLRIKNRQLVETIGFGIIR